MKSYKRHFKILGICLLASATFFACEEEDPFVDATMAPVLVNIIGAPYGLSIEKQPTVAYDSSAKELVFSARIVELDKSNILNNAIGIDSIPASNVQIAINYDIAKLKTTGKLGDITSDATGLVTFKTTYKALGFDGSLIQRKGDLIKLTWSGTYKGIAFTRLSQASVTAK
jgi:hypothetical protein